MDLMKELYAKELQDRIDAWEGLEAPDFQYEPERAELKAVMQAWLTEKLGGLDEQKVKLANKKYFASCMAEMIYKLKVEPQLKEFML